MSDYTLNELLSEPASELLKRKGFGHKALQERYEVLREIINILVKDLSDLGIEVEVEQITPKGWVKMGEMNSDRGAVVKEGRG